MSYDSRIRRERDNSQLMYRGDWFAVRAGPFEIITALEGAAPEDLLIFEEAYTGRTLWLRAGQVDGSSRARWTTRNPSTTISGG